MKIAIQGGNASFHHLAALRFFAGTDIEMVPCFSFREVCESLEHSRADMALMAVENTLAGPLTDNLQLIREYGMEHVDQIEIPIHQQLMALPGQKIDDLVIVKSHPVALVQCRQFFEAHPHIRAIQTHDTAESAHSISRWTLLGVGAIASELAAQIYGLEVLAPHIHDCAENRTRFAVIRSDPSRLRQDTPGHPCLIRSWHGLAEGDVA